MFIIGDCVKAADPRDNHHVFIEARSGALLLVNRDTEKTQRPETRRPGPIEIEVGERHQSQDRRRFGSSGVAAGSGGAARMIPPCCSADVVGRVLRVKAQAGAGGQRRRLPRLGRLQPRRAAFRKADAFSRR